MVVTERAVQGAGSSKSHDGSRRYPAPGGALDDDVVAGSEDDETEEEEHYEAMQRSAHTGRCEYKQGRAVALVFVADPECHLW